MIRGRIEDADPKDRPSAADLSTARAQDPPEELAAGLPDDVFVGVADHPAGAEAQEYTSGSRAATHPPFPVLNRTSLVPPLVLRGHY